MRVPLSVFLTILFCIVSANAYQFIMAVYRNQTNGLLFFSFIYCVVAFNICANVYLLQPCRRLIFPIMALWVAGVIWWMPTNAYVGNALQPIAAGLSILYLCCFTWRFWANYALIAGFLWISIFDDLFVAEGSSVTAVRSRKCPATVLLPFLNIVIFYYLELQRRSAFVFRVLGKTSDEKSTSEEAKLVVNRELPAALYLKKFLVKPLGS